MSRRSVANAGIGSVGVPFVSAFFCFFPVFADFAIILA
jgi:hypothetical protein